MSYTKILVHCVWGTKNRESLLIKPLIQDLLDHIKENARDKAIFIDTVNGVEDHIHCLISLGSDQSISKAVQLIKGEASYWANKQGLFQKKLSWAEDYFAGSVGIHSLEKVRGYINNQEKHHKSYTFMEEYEKFLRGHGFMFG